MRIAASATVLAGFCRQWRSRNTAMVSLDTIDTRFG
jgi:hypothetical protein